MRRAGLLLPIVALLSGCVWGGPALYGAEQAETPVPAGRYRVTVDNDPTDGVVIAEGHVTVLRVDGEAPTSVLLIPLADPTRKLWIIQAAVGPDGDRFAYGLLERTASGWAAAPYIVCAETEALVRAAGGTIERAPPPRSAGDAAAGTPTCLFRTRASLETALRQWVATHRLEATLVPLR